MVIRMYAILYYFSFMSFFVCLYFFFVLCRIVYICVFFVYYRIWLRRFKVKGKKCALAPLFGPLCRSGNVTASDNDVANTESWFYLVVYLLRVVLMSDFTVGWNLCYFVEYAEI